MTGRTKGKGSFRGSSLKRSNFLENLQIWFSGMLGLKRKKGRKEDRREGEEAASLRFTFSHFLILIMTRGRH